MSKWIPDRKVWSGGLFSVLAFFVILAANTWGGADIPLEAGAFLALAIGKAAEWLIPPSKLDIIKRLDDNLVELAAAVPESAVSREVGMAAVAVQDATALSTGDATFDALMKQMRGG